MKRDTSRKGIITNVVDVSCIPDCKHGKAASYASNIITDFMASDAQAIEVSRENTKANNLTNVLRMAAKRMGANEDIIITLRNGVVYLIKGEVHK